jgi:hypothetical protein
MEKPKIEYIIPIGKDCKIGKFLKTHNLKKTSYPFDWLYTETDQNVIIDMLEDNFEKFLDKQYHYKIDEKISGHKLYDKNESMIRHHNILEEKSFDYYKRCVDRFLEVQKLENNKLFILDIETLDNVKKIIKYIEARSKNYYIFIIKRKNVNYTDVLSKNIDFGCIELVLNKYEFNLIENTNLIINERVKGSDRFDRI